MRNGLLAIVTLSLAALAPSPVWAQKPTWHTSYEAGRAAARASGKPMMVVFRCQP